MKEIKKIKEGTIVEIKKRLQVYAIFGYFPFIVRYLRVTILIDHPLGSKYREKYRISKNFLCPSKRKAKIGEKIKIFRASQYFMAEAEVSDEEIIRAYRREKDYQFWIVFWEFLLFLIVVPLIVYFKFINYIFEYTNNELKSLIILILFVAMAAIGLHYLAKYMAKGSAKRNKRKL